jgi:SAM-dependent methyltransferase
LSLIDDKLRMRQVGNTADQFDRISPVYDETREPLKETTVSKIESILLRDRCKSIMEVGVGTGRVAKPLQDRGFEIVGIDISRGMIHKAREKNIHGLILAEANHLPIKKKSFDAALFAHVLHIFENPSQILREVSWLVRNDVIALVRKRDNGLHESSNGSKVLWRILQEASARVGYTLPIRAGGRRRKENDLLATFPPDELIEIQDELIETSIGERLSYFEKRAFRPILDIPDDTLEKVLREVRSSLPAETLAKKIHYRRIDQMALWKSRRAA